ncbi:hypothetical protein D3C72_2224880 [compost metagenome]
MLVHDAEEAVDELRGDRGQRRQDEEFGENEPHLQPPGEAEQDEACEGRPA